MIAGVNNKVTINFKEKKCDQTFISGVFCLDPFMINTFRIPETINKTPATAEIPLYEECSLKNSYV